MSLVYVRVLLSPLLMMLLLQKRGCSEGVVLPLLRNGIISFGVSILPVGVAQQEAGQLEDD